MRIRVLLAYVIGLLPTNLLRVVCYRYIFGYRIKRCRIGWRTAIYVDEANLSECSIGRNNRFFGPMKVKIEKGTEIDSRNTFTCGWWTEEENRAGKYDRSLEIGQGVHIASGHHFDIAGSLVVGMGSLIGGIGSQFWTHGAGAIKRNIRIGEHCYIGSAVRFAPGSSIGNKNIVSLGSVVTGEFNIENALIGGVPARILAKNYDWESRKNVWQQAGTARAESEDQQP